MPVVISPAPSSLPPSGAAGGDLGGTYPNPTVDLNTAGGTIGGNLAVTGRIDAKDYIDVVETSGGGSGEFFVRPAFIGTNNNFYAKATSGNKLLDLNALGFAIKSDSGNTVLRSDYDGNTYMGLNFIASVSPTGLGTFKGIHAATITSGALTTAALVSATGAQLSTAKDVMAHTPVTTDATANAATCLVELSPDNSTYSALFTLTASVAINTVGAVVLPVSLIVPAGWYLKLTVSHASIGTTTYY